MIIVRCPVSDFPFNVICNIFCFIISGIKLAELNLLSFSIICPKLLVLSTHIVADHCICSIQDIACRTIILLQFDDCRIGKFLFKIQNIFNIGSPEFINGLIIITDHTEISVFARQQTHQLELHGICILILIHHNITKPLLIILQHIRLSLKQLHRLHEQVVKIQCIIGMHLLFILLIYLGDLLFSKVPLRIQRILLCGNHLIFC